MSTAALLADELKHINAFLLVQVGVHPKGQTLTSVFDSQKTLVLSKVQHVAGLHAGAARELIEIISSGPWEPAQKSELAAAVNDRLVQSSAGDVAAGRRRLNQTVTGFHHYLSEADLTALTSQSNDIMKINTLVDKCIAMSLDIPSEKTIQHIVGVFMAIAKPGVNDPAVAFATTQEFKRLLKQRIKASPCAPTDITVYPDEPSKLPEAMFKKIFGDSKPADPSLIPQLSNIVDAGRMVPCRKSSKLVRESSSSVVQPSSSSSHFMGGHDVAHVLQAFSAMIAQHAAPRSRQPHIQFFPSNRSSLPTQSTPDQSPSALTGPQQHLAIADASPEPSPPRPPTPSTPVSATGPVASLLELPTIPVQPIEDSVEVVKTALSNRTAQKDKVKDSVKPKAKASNTKKGTVKSSSSNAASSSKVKTKANNKKNKSDVSNKGDKWLGLPSRAKRSQQFPKGCSKRRGVPGCTPSCWRARMK
jgi:hypothetical protein